MVVVVTVMVGVKSWSSSFICLNEYLAIDSNGHLCTNILHALIAVWLDASSEVEMVFDLTGLQGVKCKAL